MPSGVPSMCFRALEINCPGTPDFSTGHRTPRFFLTHPGWCTTFGIPEGAAWREAVDAVDVGRSNLEIVTLCHHYVIMLHCIIGIPWNTPSIHQYLSDKYWRYPIWSSNARENQPPCVVDCPMPPLPSIVPSMLKNTCSPKR